MARNTGSLIGGLAIAAFSAFMGFLFNEYQYERRLNQAQLIHCWVFESPGNKETRSMLSAFLIKNGQPKLSATKFLYALDHSALRKQFIKENEVKPLKGCSD